MGESALIAEQDLSVLPDLWGKLQAPPDGAIGAFDEAPPGCPSCHWPGSPGESGCQSPAGPGPAELEKGCRYNLMERQAAEWPFSRAWKPTGRPEAGSRRRLKRRSGNSIRGMAHIMVYTWNHRVAS